MGRPGDFTDLEPTRLGEHMLVVPNFLRPEECQRWVQDVEVGGKLDTVSQKATRDFAHRYHKRWQLDNSEVAKLIFERVERFVPPELDSLVPVGVSSNIRLYKYEQGDAFGPHIDESNESDEGISKFTLLVYLNTVPKGDGGRTVFFSDHRAKRELTSVQPAIGLLLLHGHGERCLTHEAEGLRRGVKYVLRSDVLYGKEKKKR